MKVLTRQMHGFADYLVVVVLLSLPMALGFTGAARTLSYSLAFFHLLVTGFSSFSPGGLPFLPFRAHALIELVAGIFLILAPWVFRFANHLAPRDAFLLVGAALLVMAAFTDFDRRRSVVPPPPGDRRRWYSRRSA